jgi:hypothetical protein
VQHLSSPPIDGEVKNGENFLSVLSSQNLGGKMKNQKPCYALYMTNKFLIFLLMVGLLILSGCGYEAGESELSLNSTQLVSGGPDLFSGVSPDTFDGGDNLEAANIRLFPANPASCQLAKNVFAYLLINGQQLRAEGFQTNVTSVEAKAIQCAHSETDHVHHETILTLTIEQIYSLLKFGSLVIDGHSYVENGKDPLMAVVNFSNSEGTEFFLYLLKNAAGSYKAYLEVILSAGIKTLQAMEGDIQEKGNFLTIIFPVKNTVFEIVYNHNCSVSSQNEKLNTTNCYKDNN